MGERVAALAAVAAATLLAVAAHRRRRRAARLATRALWLPQPVGSTDEAGTEEDVEALLRQHLPFIDWDCEPDLQAERAELMTEQLSRNEAFLGADAQAALATMCVTVVGLGGSGSHAAQLLARTGVGRLRLIDPAAVQPHSLRTSALATAADLGRPKVEVVRDALLRTVPQARFDVLVEAVSDEASARRLLCAPHAPPSDYLLVCLPPAALPAAATAIAAAVAVPETAAMGGRAAANRSTAAAASPPHPQGSRVLVCLSADARAEPPRCEVAHQRLAPLNDVCGCLEARRHHAAAPAPPAPRAPRAPSRPVTIPICTARSTSASSTTRLTPFPPFLHRLQAAHRLAAREAAAAPRAARARAARGAPRAAPRQHRAAPARRRARRRRRGRRRSGRAGAAGRRRGGGSEGGARTLQRDARAAGRDGARGGGGGARRAGGPAAARPRGCDVAGPAR